jgi:hypothetical protein
MVAPHSAGVSSLRARVAAKPGAEEGCAIATSPMLPLNVTRSVLAEGTGRGAWACEEKESRMRTKNASRVKLFILRQAAEQRPGSGNIFIKIIITINNKINIFIIFIALKGAGVSTTQPSAISGTLTGQIGDAHFTRADILKETAITSICLVRSVRDLEQLVY